MTRNPDVRPAMEWKIFLPLGSPLQSTAFEADQKQAKYFEERTQHATSWLFGGRFT